MTRVVLACPGRGAYGPGSLGSLPRGHVWLDTAEELRAGLALPSLAELDAAGGFDPVEHLRPANAAPLTYLVTLLDATRAAEDHKVVAVAGNSLGWQSALGVAGALSFEDGFRLVQQLALLSEQALPSGEPGGQVIYPLTDAAWRPDPALQSAVKVALSQANSDAHASIELGGYIMLAGTETGVGKLLASLPKVRVGEQVYPLRSALASPPHTPLAGHLASAARQLLDDLDWRAPATTLIDGRGARWTPWSTDPAALADYTLGEQMTAPYRFATSIRVALREYAPDLVLLPGPGNTLGAICGQIVVGEGYRGIRSRSAFEAAQSGRRPVVVSMRPR
ncbi:MAG: ACP S-malonyltransferase [Chloroflexota bacterium]|nr:ACP S-malonyltransferase [Chloroflexota bacterium]